jgi:hypothetical protein
MINSAVIYTKPEYLYLIDIGDIEKAVSSAD